MADRLDLGDLIYTLGFKNEAEFVSALEKIFRKAESEAGDGGKKAGKSFSDDFKNALSIKDIAIGSLIGSGVANAFAATGAAVKDFAAGSVTEFNKYNLGLAQLKLSGETNLGNLKNQISALAQQSKIFSESDISTAIGELVKQGNTAAQAFELVANGAKLAGSDVDSATGQFGNVVTSSIQLGNVLEGLGLDFKDTGRVTDVLSKAAQDSGLNVAELVDVLVQVGPSANIGRIALNDVSASAAVLSKRGFDAATISAQLRSTLGTLTGPPAELAKRFDQLGVSLVSQDGKFRDFQTVLKNLNTVMQSGGEGAAFLSKAFGPAQTAIAASLGAGAADIEAFSSKLDNAQGSAQALADTMIETAGAQEQANARIRDAQIAIGQDLAPAYANFLTSVVVPGIQVIKEDIEWWRALGATIKQAAVDLGIFGAASKKEQIESQLRNEARKAALLIESQQRTVGQAAKDAFTPQITESFNKLKKLNEELAALNAKPKPKIEVTPIPLIAPEKPRQIGLPPLPASDKKKTEYVTPTDAELSRARELVAAMEQAKKTGEGLAVAMGALKKFEDGGQGAKNAVNVAEEELRARQKILAEQKRANEEAKRLAEQAAKDAKSKQDAIDKELVSIQKKSELEKFEAGIVGRSLDELKQKEKELRAERDKALADFKLGKISIDAYRDASDKLNAVMQEEQNQLDSLKNKNLDLLDSQKQLTAAQKQNTATINEQIAAQKFSDDLTNASQSRLESLAKSLQDASNLYRSTGDLEGYNRAQGRLSEVNAELKTRLEATAAAIDKNVEAMGRANTFAGDAVSAFDPTAIPTNDLQIESANKTVETLRRNFQEYKDSLDAGLISKDEFNQHLADTITGFDNLAETVKNIPGLYAAFLAESRKLADVQPDLGATNTFAVLETKLQTIPERVQEITDKLAAQQHEFNDGSLGFDDYIAGIDASISELTALHDTYTDKTNPAAVELKKKIDELTDSGKSLTTVLGELDSGSTNLFAGARIPTLPTPTRDFVKDYEDTAKQFESIAVGFGLDLVKGIESGKIGDTLKKALGSASDFFLQEMLKAIVGPIAQNLARTVLATVPANAGVNDAGASGLGAVLGSAGGALGPLAIIAALGIPLLTSLFNQPQTGNLGANGLTKNPDGTNSGGVTPAINYNLSSTVNIDLVGGLNDATVRASLSDFVDNRLILMLERLKGVNLESGKNA